MLTTIDVKQDIIKGSLRPFYIFTGEERHVLHQYIRKISEVSGKAMQVKDTVASCARSKTNSLLAKDSCYVVYDDKDFTSNEKAWDSVENLLGNNILILILTTVDKRGKFYKRFSEQIVTFSQLHDVILQKYIKKEIDLSVENMNYLIDICERDCSRIFLEVDKIKRIQETNADSAFCALLNDGGIYIPPRDVIFEFSDAVLCRNAKKSLQLLDECLAQDEPPLRLITVLYNNMKWLLQVQGCQDTKNLEETTGLLYWQIRTVKDHCGRYRNYELVDNMRILHEREKDIKRGDVDPIIAVNSALIDILR